MKKDKLTQLLQDRVFTLSVTIALMFIVCAFIWPDKFPTFDNISLVLLNLSIESIVAVGMMLLLISGMFDLSVGSVVAFAGSITAYFMYWYGMYVPVAILVGLGFAAFIGLTNGFFVAKVGINPLIQTLAMMGIVRGLALMVAGAGLQNLPEAFNAIGQTKILGVQSPVWFMVFIVIIFSVLVSRTVFFRQYYYIGGNEKAAKLSGIRVDQVKIIGFVLTSVLAGIAGILLASRLGAALATSGRGMELRVITAVILGGASLLGGQGKIIGALLGTIFMGLVSNIMILARVSGYWQEIVLGIILILAVAVDVLAQKRAGTTPRAYVQKATEIKPPKVEV
ncbi:ABC transporter permease [Catalinimonas niigatensis]|uniref:ABC transporter permease n=1 Tax=Catalinimonas niigatensis TaxID=1397264 RepID=UPI0026670544|nr:ABC transporter permease [Catalinimonas niigatensis]WPP50956.1 ABC transporter permease [Catalinimonas niigatensis]